MFAGRSGNRRRRSRWAFCVDPPAAGARAGGKERDGDQPRRRRRRTEGDRDGESSPWFWPVVIGGGVLLALVVVLGGRANGHPERKQPDLGDVAGATQPDLPAVPLPSGNPAAVAPGRCAGRRKPRRGGRAMLRAYAQRPGCAGIGAASSPGA